MDAPHVSPYSGRWYPGNRLELETLLDGLFETSAARTGPFLLPGGLGYVVPHAGPLYSGAVAAAAYRSLARQAASRVVVIGFPHRGGLQGCAVSDAPAIRTPLGDLPVDRPFLARLPFPCLPEPSLCDHSVEIQVPFLQHALPGARFAPIYAGPMDSEERLAAAKALASAWEPGTVLLASSDFTHYGRDFGFLPFPPDRLAPGRLKKLDQECIDAAGSLDSALFLETLHRNRATVCGSAPIALLLDTLACLHAAGLAQVALDYASSADITPGRDHSVGYTALAFYPRQSFALCLEDCELLLESARRAIGHWIQTGQRRPEPAVASSPALASRRAVFVSVYHDGELRGCVGRVPATGPLASAVPELALSAALDDSRFEAPGALSGALDVEISLLAPFRLVRGEQRVCAGLHGVHLESGNRRALLLPQVARQRRWTAPELLDALAHKAGLPPHAWREPGARLSVFEAQVFGTHPPY